ncbi:low temperature requirement protein A [Rugosimonospora acidiphila]|uniref:Low temperature requirement protein A n=1 Tax=Rugosimonospora acidiphila TaxID=556531 RepID=A0ABP9RJH1_9ACTN
MHEGPQRTTLLELFFDLVFVAALALISQSLASDRTWRGALHTLILLMAIWWIWSVTALVTDLYRRQRPPILPMTIWVMSGSMVMSAAVPKAFAERGFVFALAYVAIHLGRGLFLVAALRGQPAQRHAARFLFWFAVSAAPWIAGGLAPRTAREVLWPLALVLDYGSARFRYPTPRLGRVPSSQYDVAAEHLAERYQQFFTLALGTAILATSLTFAGSAFTSSQALAFAIAFTTTVVLWRLYVHRAGVLLQPAIESARDPGRLLRSAPYTHLVMVAGVVVTAAGFESLIGHPTAQLTPSVIILVLGGPALFLAGRARFEYEVFTRVSPSRLAGLLALAATAAAIRLLTPLIAGGVSALILVGIAVADAVRARRGRPERPSPSL